MDMSVPLGPVGLQAAPDRDAAIRDRYLRGETLASIGRAFGVSAERVRKIVKRFGLDKSNAGLAVRNRRGSTKVRKPPHSVRIYGCTEAELEPVPADQRQAFLQQRTNVRRSAGVTWELTLPQWVRVWGDSGRWEERGQGPLKYGLSRIDPTAPYNVANVQIARNHDSAMRGRNVRSAERRKQALEQTHNEKWIRDMTRILKKSTRPDGPPTDSAKRQ